MACLINTIPKQGFKADDPFRYFENEFLR